jgi:ectoine hydroxylase-related dioxygenase (phytanoyl-CoA dioxygenase family)
MKLQEGRACADHYAEQGYCQIRPVSREFLVNVDRAARSFAQLMQERIDEPYIHGYTNESGKHRQLRYVHYRTDAFSQLMRSEEISDLVRSIFGSQRMYVTHSKVSHKEAGQNLAWYPHQDNGYKLLHKIPIRDGITIIVFLEDTDERNGTIQVFPGSHKLKTLPHIFHPSDESDLRQLVVQTLPEIEPVAIIAKKGDILAFGLDMIHQSPPNRFHGYRPVFLFEIKPHEGYPMNEWGRTPLLINGELNSAERFGYFLVRALRGARIAFK